MKRHLFLNLTALIGCVGWMLSCSGPANAQSPTRPAFGPSDAFQRPGDSFRTPPRIRRVSLDQSRFTEERKSLLSAEVRQAFPRLGDDFEVIGPATGDYNAISHSLGVYDRWIGTETGPAHDVLAKMDKLYADHGFFRIDTLDMSLEPGKEKVVVYMTQNPDASWKEVTSAAVQEADGSWTSKPGKLAPIRHRAPQALQGPVYGVPAAVYVRTTR